MQRLQQRNVAQLRLRNQHLAQQTFENPADVVRWFGAVQAQDFAAAQWALGLRTKGAVLSDVQEAIVRREIVRTWPMRGTLHFVARDDVRWMLELLTSRVIRSASARHRQLELDDRVFARAEKVISKALLGGRQLTRPAVYEALGAAGIATRESRGLHIIGYLAMRRVLCFGAHAGKQPTLVLLDEWVPNAKSMPRDVALAELALRYFTSHGPATVQDFSWWAGLTLRDARSGAESARPQLVNETVDGISYWLSESRGSPRRSKATSAHLLPAYDEYTVAYRDRSAVLTAAFAKRVNAGGGILKPVVIVDGQVVGTWNKAVQRNQVAVSVSPFTPISAAQQQRIETAAERYGAFLQMPVATSRATANRSAGRVRLT